MIPIDAMKLTNGSLGRDRYDKFIKPFCGPAAKNLSGYIRWLEVRLTGWGQPTSYEPHNASPRRADVRNQPRVDLSSDLWIGRTGGKLLECPHRVVQFEC